MPPWLVSAGLQNRASLISKHRRQLCLPFEGKGMWGHEVPDWANQRSSCWPSNGEESHRADSQKVTQILVPFLHSIIRKRKYVYFRQQQGLISFGSLRLTQQPSHQALASCQMGWGVGIGIWGSGDITCYITCCMGVDLLHHFGKLRLTQINLS